MLTEQTQPTPILDVSATLAQLKLSYPSTLVDKNLILDEGNLLVSDDNPLSNNIVKDIEREKELKELGRENLQGLFNSLWNLPTTNFNGVVLVTLPKTKLILPREKPIPEDKPETKWEAFAKLKGIKKKKKSKMVYDETEDMYKPSWGYKGINKKNDWITVLPHQADPFTDIHEIKDEETKRKVLKNKKQQLGNINQNIMKKNIEKNIVMSKKSTASIGKFDRKIKEPKIKIPNSKKNKFSPVVESKENRGMEKERSKAILKKILASGTKAESSKIAIIEKTPKKKKSYSKKNQKKIITKDRKRK